MVIGMQEPTTGNSTPPPLHTPEEVAPLVGKSPRWLKDQARRREIPHHKVGHSYRFSDANIAEIIASTAVPAGSSAAAGTGEPA